MEYREKFFEEINELLSYFVQFGEDESILSKKYLRDYAVGGPNIRPIIMITHDKSRFSANDRCQKV